MFKFKPTNQTYSDPVSATFTPGIPFGREYSRGDICLLHDEIPGSKMFFNSKILRQAMLDSKDYLEEALEIKITDTHSEVPEINQKEDPEIAKLQDMLSGKESKKTTGKKSTKVKEESIEQDELPTNQTGDEVTIVDEPETN